MVRIHRDFTSNAVQAFQNKKKLFWFHTRASKVHFRSTEGQTFYWPIMTADDSIKCGWVNSGMTGQVGSFQNRRVCQQAFPSFLPHPLPALLLALFFARSLTLAPLFFLRNRTETLATQAMKVPKFMFCQARTTQDSNFVNFSFPDLWYSPLEFNSKNICQHLTK